MLTGTHYRGNLLSDEGIAALKMMRDEMNSKRGPDEHKLEVDVELFYISYN